MDAEKGESTKSPKKDKSAAENGSTMVVIKNEQEDKPKNPAELDVHPVFPEKQFATATTAEKPMNDDLKMPQQDQMDLKQGKSTKNEMGLKGPHQEKSSVQLTSEQSTMKQGQQALNQESQKLQQQQDSTPAVPQQQNQMDVEKGESKKSSKKEKENGSKMVVINEDQQENPFINDVRPKFPVVTTPIHDGVTKPKQEEQKTPSDIRPIFPTKTTMQQPADPQQDQKNSKGTILYTNVMDNLKGPHQEKSSASLTPEPQQIMQEQQVRLTHEQLQILQKQLQLMIDRQQLEREQEKLKQDQQKLKQQQEQLEQQQRKMKQQQREQQLNSNLPQVNATKTIMNLETAAEYQCCLIHVKTLTRLIAVLHACIILALLITIFCTSNLKSLNGFEIAGFILLGCSILTVAALFAGICLEDAKFLFIHVSYGWVELTAMWFFGVYLCVIHFGHLTSEQLGITPTGAIILTAIIGITLIALRMWSCFVVDKCVDYYEENQKKS